MSYETLIALVVGVVLLGLLGFAWLSERRRKLFGFTPSEDHVFRCTQCHFVYTDDPDVDRSRCPHCGQANDMITF
ncbi:MAG: hypothetical protein FJ405_03745 [Verrucomicrobia bacterium]|nr:hypothetical protein [Verrucomicrobiota bacterium]